ncbi:nucleotidyltransferase family protein [Paenibacillus agilis]|uniref:Nucleotidyltransferase family protein n=1 Tax=Paenibacillus agilis TaxID=3020863 RepID=A0A559J3C6_9BACL|nr:nucleotidyltransferase family protein [Paenibacillus agilis]TVX94379.1 nucleotidyltransferase family protein [Paenibacillus agilis]
MRLLQEQLITIMRANNHLLRDLALVKQLNLPHWCIAAGYVRNAVWDYMHGYVAPTLLNDVDILYYDPNHLCEDTEKQYEAVLREQVGDYNWSIKNQARMHLRNNASPYASVVDAMKRWPETATATGIYLDDENQIQIVAPHGLDDLFGLVIRRSPYFQDRDYFHARIHQKKWLGTYPKLRVIE